MYRYQPGRVELFVHALELPLEDRLLKFWLYVEPIAKYDTWAIAPRWKTEP